MNPGRILVDAISTHAQLQEINDCPAVPVRIGTAVYGGVQDDDNETQITLATTRDHLITQLWCKGPTTETAVWHFSTRPTVHHFVVIPWYNQTEPGWCYAMFMAYEGAYRFKHYANPQPADNNHNVPPNGYRADRSIVEIVDMLMAIVANGGAWQQYFASNIHNAHVTDISLYKYPNISLANANASVAAYNG
jgi:hypothetical protein